MAKFFAFYKVLLLAVLSVSVLSACQKQEDTAQEPQSVQTATHSHDHDHDDDEHDHDHDDHHHHHAGDVYQCDNGKIAHIVVHNHEGEIEAHATIDDIEYDLPQDENDTSRYVSPEGLNNEGMVMVLDGDKASFSTLDGKTTHLSCVKEQTPSV